MIDSLLFFESSSTTSYFFYMFHNLSLNISKIKEKFISSHILMEKY